MMAAIQFIYLTENLSIPQFKTYRFFTLAPSFEQIKTSRKFLIIISFIATDKPIIFNML